MSRFLIALVLLSLGAAARAEVRGTLVVGGNELSVDSLEVVGERVFVGDIQVWPPVLRPSAERDRERERLLHDPAPALTTRMHQTNLASRAKERQLHSQGHGRRAIADSIAAFYRSHSDLVRDATADSAGSQVWIFWANGQREGWLPDNNLGAPTPSVSPAASMADLWRRLLARGCMICVGDGYVFYVPARRSSVQASLRQTLASRAPIGDGEGRQRDDGLEHLRGKQPELLRDLHSPQPLDSLRTRR
jgi:hypothetical protein